MGWDVMRWNRVSQVARKTGQFQLRETVVELQVSSSLTNTSHVKTCSASQSVSLSRKSSNKGMWANDMSIGFRRPRIGFNKVIESPWMKKR